MDTLIVVVLLVIVGVIAWYVVKYSFLFLKAIWQIGDSPEPRTSTRAGQSDELDGMNYGDYFNGPSGYVAGSSYPDARDEQRGDG